jgi:hypothetical protein
MMIVIYNPHIFIEQAKKVFVADRHFQPSLIFMGKRKLLAQS